jgi:hypothetical protein
MRSPFKVAFLNPLNLAILICSLTFGLCAAWWLLPVGLILWAIMFLRVYRDPALKLDQTIQSRAPLTQRFQKPFDRIQRGQITLFNNLRGTKPAVSQSLLPLQDAVNSLTDQAYNLCLRMTALQNYYLVTKNNRDFEGESFVMKVKIDNSTDEKTRKDYEDSRRILEEQADNFRKISILLDRVEAQLSTVSSTIDMVVVEAIRLQNLQAEDINKGLLALLQAIQAQSDQLSAFEKEAAGSSI